MKYDFGFSDVMYGFGVVVFYVGYVCCEVLSNMLFVCFGVCCMFMWIMLLWGFVLIGMMFVL